MDLSDIYRISHSKTVEYSLFPGAQVMLYKIDHILGHKATLSKYKKIEFLIFYLITV